MIGPKGKFMLAPGRRPDAHLHLVRDRQRAVRLDDEAGSSLDGPPRRAIFLNGVSYADEIGYRDAARGLGALRRVPGDATSRPSRGRPIPRNADWTGRTGRVEMILDPVLDELGLSPANSIAYICGNPDMITAAEADAPRPRLPRGPGQQGALLAEGQGAPRRWPARDLAAAIDMAEENEDQ